MVLVDMNVKFKLKNVEIGNLMISVVRLSINRTSQYNEVEMRTINRIFCSSKLA